MLNCSNCIFVVIKITIRCFPSSRCFTSCPDWSLTIKCTLRTGLHLHGIFFLQLLLGNFISIRIKHVSVFFSPPLRTLQASLPTSLTELGSGLIIFVPSRQTSLCFSPLLLAVFSLLAHVSILNAT